MSFPTLFNTDKTETETLADELFGEDTRTDGHTSVYAQLDDDVVNRLVYRIEDSPRYVTACTVHPMYDMDSDEISVYTGNRPKILADKDWVNINFATAGSVIDSTARLESLEYWQSEIVRQDANTNAVITSLLQRIDRLERMIYNEK